MVTVWIDLTLPTTVIFFVMFNPDSNYYKKIPGMERCMFMNSLIFLILSERNGLMWCNSSLGQRDLKVWAYVSPCNSHSENQTKVVKKMSFHLECS